MSQDLDREIETTLDLLSKATGGVWSVEPHGQYIALYSDRLENQHGLRLMNFDDGDSNYQNNINAIPAAVNGYIRLANELKAERANSEQYCNAWGQSQINASNLAERLDGIDTELALVLKSLWERSTEEQRETIKMNYPNWTPGDLNVFIKWSPMDSSDFDTTESLPDQDDEIICEKTP